MHFVIRFYNKHQIDLASSNVIDSDDRRIKSNQHEERIAFNLDQYESDHERDANERTTRMQQQATTRIKRAIRAKAHIVQNDDDEESTREKQASTQKSTRKKQTSTQTKEIATTRVQEKKKKTTSVTAGLGFGHVGQPDPIQSSGWTRISVQLSGLDKDFCPNPRKLFVTGSVSSSSGCSTRGLG
jgi:FKBP-type peptidyl-prolyl cis-trans isomerase